MVALPQSKKSKELDEQMIVQVANDSSKHIVVAKSDSSLSLGQKDKIEVPKAINEDHFVSSEKLPVYTEKKWVPNKDDVPDEVMKNQPTLAKVEPPKNTSDSAKSLTIIQSKVEVKNSTASNQTLS